MYELAHIILIDDNDGDRELHKAVLRKAGFSGELTLFQSAQDALSEITGDTLNGRKTLLLVDINMPALDGFELISTMVGELSSHSEVSIVMLSSAPDDQDRLCAESLPIIGDYLAKPLTLDGSVRLMNRFLA